MDMQITIMDRNAKQAFAAAMSSCQREMPMIVRNAENKQTSSSYAKHEMICKEIKPIYTSHGFSLSFHEGDARDDAEIRTICDVEHELGYSKTYHIDLPADGAGIKGNANKTAIHAKGSTFSYGRRYLTMMIFDLATYDDNDASVAPDKPKISEEQELTIDAMLSENEIDKDKFLSWLNKSVKAESIAAINVNSYDSVIRQIKTNIKRKENAKNT